MWLSCGLRGFCKLVAHVQSYMALVKVVICCNEQISTLHIDNQLEKYCISSCTKIV
jgi:hypothetical protein